MRVLIIEDYAPTLNSLTRELKEEGHVIDATADGHEGLWFAEQNHYDVIILDLMLPGISGWDILQKLRAQEINAQIIVLTARDSLEDRVKGLDLGADDYLVKPFAMAELKARIRASFRRQSGMKNPVINLPCGLQLDTVRKQVFLRGEHIELTPRELALLEYFIARSDELVTRSDVWDNVYEFNSKAQSNVVDVYVGRLRKKLKLPNGEPLIATRRGQGYMLESGNG